MSLLRMAIVNMRHIYDALAPEIKTVLFHLDIELMKAEEYIKENK